MAGLYIHIPFCKTKCPYCDFVSGPFPVEIQKRYVGALLREIETTSQEAEASCFDTLYIGGGTPTVLPVEWLVSILEKTFDLFSWSDIHPEVTIEANPGSVTERGLRELRAAGVNRISLGVQSLSPGGLKVLGRSHSVSDSLSAYRYAREVGFPLVSLDLIYGLPGQDVEGWHKDLEGAISLGPDHISCYELTVEGDTPLKRAVLRGEVVLPDEETVLEMTDLTEDLLARNGYRQYEISNFAIPGRECRHNINYWENGAYLGLGCSAVSFLPPYRERNIRDIFGYIESVRDTGRAIEEQEVLDTEARFRESVTLALRLIRGISLPEFSEKWRYDPIIYYGDTLKVLLARGLLALEDQHLFLTREGRRLANVVLSELV